MYKWHGLCGKNSLGCCFNHYATAFCTSSHMNLQPMRAFCNVPEMLKLHGGKSRLWCIMTEHLTSKHGIQLVLEPCVPCGDGQWWCQWVYWNSLSCSWYQLLKTLTVMVCGDGVSRTMSPEAGVPRVNITLLVDACDLNFCGWGEMDHPSIACLLIFLWIQ
jgi:hypothetical protein